MGFIPGMGPAPEGAEGWWFLFHGTQLLVVDGEEKAPEVPRVPGPGALGLAPNTSQCLGELDEVPCFVGAFDAAPEAVPPGHRFVSLRELFGVVDEDRYAAATRAAHLAQWDLVHRFCGRCGGPLELKSDERARACAACGQVYFPQISPAVIVAVRRGDRILLARSPRFPPGMCSVLAGFVEPGESLEACARREIREEVGIEVRNLRYFASQPWPYPNSLMLGFTAEYESGEIQVDGHEVLEAGWYSADNLPGLPGKLSIARALIDAFLESVTGPASGRPGLGPGCSPPPGCSDRSVGSVRSVRSAAEQSGGEHDGR